MSAAAPKDQQNVSSWLVAFSDEDRRQQLKEDAAAWGRVTGVLLVVVTLGLLLSIAAVIIAQIVPNG